MRTVTSMTIIALSFFMLSCLGCDKIRTLTGTKANQQDNSPIVRGPLVAKINEYPISLEDLDQDVTTYNALVPADRPELKITTREQKVEYLKKDVVRRILLYQEALRRGLAKKEDILRELEKTKVDLLVIELLREELDKTDVTAKEIEEYYNVYQQELKEPEERQLREIVVSSEQEGKDVLILLLQGYDFAQLARERSKAPSAGNGGDLGYIKREAKFPQFDAVAFSDTLEIGRVSAVFKGPDGYYIVKLEGKKGGKQKSLTEMWEEIKRGLTILKQRNKIDSLVSRLQGSAKLEFHEGEIK